MKKLVVSLSIILLCGCASFSTKMFRAEELSVDLVTGYTKAFNAYYNNLSVDKQKELEPSKETLYNQVRTFAASVKMSETLRQEYEKNKTEGNKQAVLLTIDSLNKQSSNIVWTINFIKGQL